MKALYRHSSALAQPGGQAPCSAEQQAALAVLAIPLMVMSFYFTVWIIQTEKKVLFNMCIIYFGTLQAETDT